MPTVVMPLVPLVVIVVSGIAGGGGAVVGTIGGVQRKRAQAQIRHHTTRFEKRHTAHLAKVDRANAALQSLGRAQERAQRDVISRMQGFLERQSKQVRAPEHPIVDGVDDTSTPVAVAVSGLDPDVAGWVGIAGGAALVGGATPIVLRGAAARLAKASTGRPIADLCGAAADRATRAFFGGGSIVAGGGGMALGALVLKAAAVGAAVFVAGIVVKSEGTKARTAAADHRAQSDAAIADLDLHDQFLRGVTKRAHELEGPLLQVISLATNALDLLESEPFDPAAHGERLLAAHILARTVRAVATAPIADEDGRLGTNTEQLILRYRDTHKETPDG
ncbi:hypothetical protein ACIQXD_35180 [Streptomyces uncialis]|uniref:hypothetical protein n=1 Tax=Streptomyces uncialis TaxID=1048205 RepID=UPI003819BB51